MVSGALQGVSDGFRYVSGAFQMISEGLMSLQWLFQGAARSFWVILWYDEELEKCVYGGFKEFPEHVRMS